MKHWITLSHYEEFSGDGLAVDEHETKDAALAFAEANLLRKTDAAENVVPVAVPTVVYLARVEHSIHAEHRVRVEGVA